MKWLVALTFLGLNFYIYHFLATEEVEPPRVSLSYFPTAFDDWHCLARDRMAKAVEDELGVTDYIVCDFVKQTTLLATQMTPEERAQPPVVGVYIGYHASQTRREGGGNGVTMIHPPAHCLPGSGWDIIAAQL